MPKVKVQITVDDALLSRVDAYADEHYTSRSGVFSAAAENLLLTDEMRQAISKMADAFQRMSLAGNFTDEDMQQLKAFQVLASSFSGRV